jgi:lipopolysaccharide transport system permease protein
MTMAARDDLFAHSHVTVIAPTKGWRMLDVAELWAYRELLWVLASRDVQVRYKQSVLGAGWAILRPLASMAIFTVIFGLLAHMPSDGVPYPLFVYAGLLPWNYFASSISASGNSLVGSAHLVSKVYFPRLIIPLSSISAAFVDLVVSMAVLFAMLLWYGIGFHAQLLAVPVLLAGLTIAALGIGTLLSALTVSYRDFTHITPFLVQLWMYATPVIFPVSLVPAQWRWVVYLNPLTGFVEGFRDCILGRALDWNAIGVSMLLAIASLVVGVAYFERAERRFADVI